MKLSHFRQLPLFFFFVSHLFQAPEIINKIFSVPVIFAALRSQFFDLCPKIFPSFSGFPHNSCAMWPFVPSSSDHFHIGRSTLGLLWQFPSSTAIEIFGCPRWKVVPAFSQQRPLASLSMTIQNSFSTTSPSLITFFPFPSSFSVRRTMMELSGDLRLAACGEFVWTVLLCTLISVPRIWKFKTS